MENHRNMINNFEKAIQTILKHEGGYVDNKMDPGGATNFGISLRFLKDFVTKKPEEFSRFDVNHDGNIDYVDIKNLPQGEAINLYKQAFWDKNNYDKITDFSIAEKIFDLAVNMGGAQANKLLQRAIRAVTGIKLVEDGILGTKSFAQINSADPNSLLAALKSEAAGFYRTLVRVDPNLQGFLDGWLNRSYF